VVLPIQIGKWNARSGSIKEIHITETVEYVLECLEKMDRQLDGVEISNISDLLGEVIANAEEHSSLGYRYSIGYFKMDDNPNYEILGELNLSIFNFGQTIYQKFKDPACPNPSVVT